MALHELAPIRVDAQGARAFVLAHGSAREKARLEGIFGTVGPARTVVKELEALQNADGGFPARGEAGGPSSIDATCYLLSQLKDMPPLSGSPMASRAVAFLRRVQQNDGCWMESGAAAGAVGPWAHPDNPHAAPYLTALATYSMMTLEPEQMDSIRRGAAWLRRALGGDRTGEETPVQTLALAWAVFCRVHGPNSHEAGWCFHHVIRREMDAAELSWCLTCALEVGAGGPFVLPIAKGLGRLSAMQQPDGAWPAEEGLLLESTLTALRVFRGYGVL